MTTDLLLLNKSSETNYDECDSVFVNENMWLLINVLSGNID